jgi:hypothetical protein
MLEEVPLKLSLLPLASKLTVRAFMLPSAGEMSRAGER